VPNRASSAEGAFHVRPAQEPQPVPERPGGPATERIPVTPPDNADLPIVGVAILPVGMRRVMATGTTATSIHRLAADVGQVGMRTWCDGAVGAAADIFSCASFGGFRLAPLLK